MSSKIIRLLLGLFLLAQFFGCAIIFRNVKEKSFKEEVLCDIHYITTAQQKREIKQLETKVEIRRYLKSFWKELDPSPVTGKNEFKEEYDRRLAHARQFFRYGKFWMSDRARVCLLYGIPDQINSAPFIDLPFGHSKMINALEIWLYDKPAGYFARPSIFSNLYPNQQKFVFADINGLGRYVQIFSSESGEVIDLRVYSLDSEEVHCIIN